MDGPLSIYLMNPDACDASPAHSIYMENGPIAYSQPVQFHLLIMDIRYFTNFVFHTSTDGLPDAVNVKPINKTAK